MASFIAVLWTVNESRTKNGIKNIKKPLTITITEKNNDMGFYGHYENQFVDPQTELTNISLSFSLATVTVRFLLCVPLLKIVCSGWESNFASFLTN